MSNVLMSQSAIRVTEPPLMLIVSPVEDTESRILIPPPLLVILILPPPEVRAASVISPISPRDPKLISILPPGAISPELVFNSVPEDILISAAPGTRLFTSALS